jgi:hypothetical protein
MHRVSMSFVQREGWHRQFLEADLKAPLPKKLGFLSQDMMIQLAGEEALSRTFKPSRRSVTGLRSDAGECGSI